MSYLTSLFRKIYKEDISWGRGSAFIKNNANQTVEVHDVNSTVIPVLSNDLQDIGDTVEDVLLALQDDIENIDIDDKINFTNEDRDIKTTGDMEADTITVNTAIDANNTIIKNVGAGFNDTDGINKKQLDDVKNTIITAHNNLSGIDGGAEDDNFHLTQEQHSSLTNGNTTDIHKHVVDYGDIENKLEAGKDIDITDNKINNVRENEYAIRYKIAEYNQTGEAQAPNNGEFTLGKNVDGALELKIADYDLGSDVVELTGFSGLFNLKYGDRVFLRLEDKTNYDCGIELFITENVSFETGFIKLTSSQGLFTIKGDILQTLGLEMSYSLVIVTGSNVTEIVNETAEVVVSSIQTESFSGSKVTQQGVNEENVIEFNNIYNLLEGNSPAFGDLRGAGGSSPDDLPVIASQDVPDIETVATFTTIKQSSNEDVWEFIDTTNEILIKKAGFYTWNTQIELTNDSNQTRFLVFSTRNKNDNTEVFYTREISVSRDGVNNQSSITFEVPNDNTNMEITIYGHNSAGAPNDDLTIISWDTSLLLNFVTTPIVSGTTNNINVSDSALESLSGTSVKQDDVNIENKIAIKSIQSDLVLGNDRSCMIYSATLGTAEPIAGEMSANFDGGIWYFKVNEFNLHTETHEILNTLKDGASITIFDKNAINNYVRGIILGNVVEENNGAGNKWLTFSIAPSASIGTIDGKTVLVDFRNTQGSGTGTTDHFDLSNIGTKTHVEIEAELSKVKVSDTDTTTGRLIDKISAGSNVTITTVNENGDEKLLITSSGEVSSIVKQGVNYYNLGNDICNNVNGVGFNIVNIASVEDNGTGWLMKSANGNVLTDIPTVANVTYAEGLSPAIPILDNTKAIQMKLRTGNCRVKDLNRNNKTGTAYVEINVFEIDYQSIVSSNHTLVQTVQLMDANGGNNDGVVGSGQTSNDYVTFELTNLNGIFTLDSTKQYGFTISGTSDTNSPVSLEKIHLMDTALLTVIFEGEVL